MSFHSVAVTIMESVEAVAGGAAAAAAGGGVGGGRARRPRCPSKHSQRQLYIIAQLSECVKTVLHEYASDREQPVLSCQTSDDLCAAVEALFIHGLRGTRRLRMAPVASLRRPAQPSFWPSLMLITHSSTLRHIEQMSQIRSEIGRCRAWVRLSFNDSLLTSYLTTLVSLADSLRVHYDECALLRQPEHVQLVMGQLVGLEGAHRFQLAANCSLLNSWSEAPLRLAGLLSEPPPAPHGVGAPAPAVDAAAAIATPAPSLGAASSSSSADWRHRGNLARTPSLILNALDPDTALDMIVKWRRDQHYQQQQPSVEASECGASLLSCSEPELSFGCRGIDAESVSGHTAAPVPAVPAADTDQSFVSVLESYRQSSPHARSLMLTPEVRLVMGTPPAPAVAAAVAAVGDDDGHSATPPPPPPPPRRSRSRTASPDVGARPQAKPSAAAAATATAIEKNSSSSGSSSDTGGAGGTAVAKRDNPMAGAAGYATSCGDYDGRDGQAGAEGGVGVKAASVTGSSSDNSPRSGKVSLPAPLHALCHPVGLSGQRYRCADCGRFVGLLYGRPRVCAVDARYYCADCHTGSRRAVVPARVLHNWDLSAWPVSERSWRRLQLAHHTQLYNLWHVNAALYPLCGALDRMRRLRTQAVFLYAFLSTCRAAADAALVTFQRTLSGHDDNSSGGVGETEAGPPVALLSAQAADHMASGGGNGGTSSEGGSRHCHLWSHVHTYTMADLMAIGDGRLECRLRRAVSESRLHVLACPLCSQKGFICEVCRDTAIIYPFDLHATVCCRCCGAVFHKQCWQRVQWLCARCERRKARAAAGQQQQTPPRPIPKH